MSKSLKIPRVVISLFTDENGNPRQGFETQAETYKLKELAKRGSYNKTPKIEPINPYLELQQIQMKLGAFLPTDTPQLLEQCEDMVFCCVDNLINVYFEIYDGGVYNYQGELYADEPEKIMLVELIGTEEMSITNRLSLHKELLELLCNDVQLNKAVKLMQTKIQAIPKKEKVEIDRRLIG